MRVVHCGELFIVSYKVIYFSFPALLDSPALNGDCLRQPSRLGSGHDVHRAFDAAACPWAEPSTGL